MSTYNEILMGGQGIAEKKRQWFRGRYMQVVFLRIWGWILEREDFCTV